MDVEESIKAHFSFNFKCKTQKKTLNFVVTTYDWFIIVVNEIKVLKGRIPVIQTEIILKCEKKTDVNTYVCFVTEQSISLWRRNLFSRSLQCFFNITAKIRTKSSSEHNLN